MLLLALPFLLAPLASMARQGAESTIVLRGRAVGLDGAPIRSLQVASHSLPPRRVGPGHSGPSDSVYHGALPVCAEEDGRFEITLLADQAPAEEWYLVLEERGDRPGGDDPARGARLDRLFPWIAGQHDLGQVVLEPTPMLVSGRVLDEFGGAIEYAMVSVQIGQTWVFPTAVSPGPDGTFAFRRDTPRRSISLSVSTGFDYVELPTLEVAHGTAHLDIRLRRAGGVSGRLRWPEDAPPKACEVRLLPVDVDAAEVWASHETDGSFFAGRLLPGRWRLHVEARPLDLRPVVEETEPRLALERDFDVLAGSVTSLGDLVPVPSLHVWRVQTETGALVYSGWWSEAAATTGPRSFESAEIRSLTVPAAIAVGASGFRDALFDATTKTFVLRPGIPIALQVALPLETVPSGRSLCIGLARGDGPEVPPPWLWTGPLDERGFVRWGAPGPGTYRVWWILSAPFSRLSLHAVRDGNAIVEVDEGANGEQRFELAPSAGARVELEDMMRGLGPLSLEPVLEGLIRNRSPLRFEPTSGARDS